ncbi:MAG: type IV pilus assembly protein PilM [Patescibacteria group bacterium]
MASFIESIKKIFSQEHGKRIVGIDIGASSIKIVEVENVDDRAVLRNYGEIGLGSLAGVETGQSTNLPHEKLSDALLEILKETGIETKHSAIAIPFSASLLTVAELPNVGEKELESMIPLEARRYIPVPISEVSLDWWILPKRKKEIQKVELPPQSGTGLGKTEVMIAAIHNEVIAKYETIKKNAQLSEKTSHFEIEIFSTLRAVVGGDLAPTLMIDIGAAGTKLAVIDEGVVRGSHVVSFGGQDITFTLSRSLSIPFNQAEEMKCRFGMLGEEEGRDVKAVAEPILAKMIGEVRHFIENYEHKYDTKINKIILVGGGARLKGVDKNIAESFHGVDVSIGSPFSRVDGPALLGPTLKELGPSFAVAIGVALKALEE